MRLIRELKEIGEEYPDIIIVLTGEGNRERHILTTLCPKYNGQSKCLWFPDVPRGGKQTGKAALNIIDYYARKLKYERFLFLMDREHFYDSVEEQLRKHLENKVKMRVEATHDLVSGKAFLIRGYAGGRMVQIWVAVQGRIRLEDEMSDLIRLKFGEEVKPQKGEIRNFVKRAYPKMKSSKHYQILLERASKKYLEQALPGLCAALKRIEEDVD